jgi:hypothetical protein
MRFWGGDVGCGPQSHAHDRQSSTAVCSSRRRRCASSSCRSSSRCRRATESPRRRDAALDTRAPPGVVAAEPASALRRCARHARAAWRRRGRPRIGVAACAALPAPGGNAHSRRLSGPRLGHLNASVQLATRRSDWARLAVLAGARRRHRSAHDSALSRTRARQAVRSRRLRFSLDFIFCLLISSAGTHDLCSLWRQLRRRLQPRKPGGCGGRYKDGYGCVWICSGGGQHFEGEHEVRLRVDDVPCACTAAPPCFASSWMAFGARRSWVLA